MFEKKKLGVKINNKLSLNPVQDAFGYSKSAIPIRCYGLVI